MISQSLGIYRAYKREEAMEEVRSTPFSDEVEPQMDQSQGRTFTPEDQKRYSDLRKIIAEKEKTNKLKKDEGIK